MLFHNTAWMRENSLKMCATLKQQFIDDYTPLKLCPRFLQKLTSKLRRKWHKQQVIIQFDPLLRQPGGLRSLSRSLGFKVKEELDIINAVSATLSTEQLERVIGHNSVVKVWHDYQVKALLDVASSTIGAPGLWPAIGESYYTGAGVTVAVIDSGVYPHPDLADRIAGFKDFIHRKKEAYDDNGHGTHVAGCIASNGSSSQGKFKAPAPGAKIVALKALDKHGSGSLSTVIKAAQWCRNNAVLYNIKVVNLSIGSSAKLSYHDDPLCMTVEELWRSGLVVCVSAGNSGPGSGSICTPGIDPLVITVGASNDYDSLDPRDDQVADFSGRGPTIDGLIKPDLLTPGNNIISLRSPKSILDLDASTRYDEYYSVMSGTSMAAPICAGAVALLLEMKPELSPSQVKEALIQSCRLCKPYQYSVYDQGAGLVNLANIK